VEALGNLNTETGRVDVVHELSAVLIITDRPIGKFEYLEVRPITGKITEHQICGSQVFWDR